MRTIPMVGQDLVDYLRASFPVSDALMYGADLATIHRLQGKHAVIDHLESLMRTQARRAAESNITVS